MTKQHEQTLLYTEEEWARIALHLSGLSAATISAARKFLVDGSPVREIAESTGVSRQTVHTAIKRVRARAIESDSESLVSIVAWVKPSAVPDVAEVAKQFGGYMTDREGKNELTD